MINFNLILLLLPFLGFLRFPLLLQLPGLDPLTLKQLVKLVFGLQDRLGLVDVDAAKVLVLGFVLLALLRDLLCDRVLNCVTVFVEFDDLGSF